MKNRWLLLGLLLSAMARGGTLPPAEQARLKVRCFVWNPARCTETTRRLDEELVKKLTRKLTREQAANQTIQDGWDALKLDDVVTGVYRFNQTLLLDPKRAEAWWGAGTGLVRAGLGEQAELVCARAIELDPKRPEPHLVLAQALIQRGKRADAQNEYKKALDLGAKGDPDLEKTLGIKN